MVLHPMDARMDRPPKGPDARADWSDGGDEALHALLQAISSGDSARATQCLAVSPRLAAVPMRRGAARTVSVPYFLRAIGHHVYAGDTALHIAAAGYQADIARDLLERGATPRARNRLGAEPLHYASVGRPGSAHWNPEAQASVIEHLVRAGANPNSVDKSGAAPLHRAVRTRCAAAVRALLDRGAEPLRTNGGGSTPLHLAVWSTGRGGSGEADARQQQAEIIRLLLTRGARPSDKDTRGRTVSDCVTSAWVKALLPR